MVQIIIHDYRKCHIMLNKKLLCLPVRLERVGKMEIFSLDVLQLPQSNII